MKGLQADSNHTTHSLAVIWISPVGVYDGYSVQLLGEDDAPVGEVLLSAGVTHYLFEGLVPGRIYTVHLKTFSNTSYSKDVKAQGQTRKTRLEFRDLPFRSCLLLDTSDFYLIFSPGPAAVKDLHLLSKSTSELAFGWNMSEGWVDYYDLHLYNQDNVRHDHKKVGSKDRSCIFPHLLSGTLYKLVVISRSRGMSSESILWARTGETLQRHTGTDPFRMRKRCWV